MPSTSPSATPKKNKGGRPKSNSAPPGRPGITWKIISNPPGSLNHYEVSNQGEVRRKLKDGRWSNVKPWITGGPYAAVYLYGFRNATRNRKKVYIHRLVAEHFVRGRKKGEVVHHKQGPANNTAAQLEWVSVEENANARKYFNPDGTRKGRVKGRVHRPNAPPGIKKQKGNPKPPDDSKHDKGPDAKPVAPKKPIAKKPIAKKPIVAKKKLAPMDRFPDHDEYIPNVETAKKKIRYLTSRSTEVGRAYLAAKAVHPQVSSSTIPDLFRKATGKLFRFQDGRSPYHWKTYLISALHAIKTRLET